MQAVNAKLAPLGHTVSDGVVHRELVCMAKRLEELVNARDRLLADVSHELRSPLARRMTLREQSFVLERERPVVPA